MQRGCCGWCVAAGRPSALFVNRRGRSSGTVGGMAFFKESCAAHRPPAPAQPPAAAGHGLGEEEARLAVAALQCLQRLAGAAVVTSTVRRSGEGIKLVPGSTCLLSAALRRSGEGISTWERLRAQRSAAPVDAARRSRPQHAPQPPPLPHSPLRPNPNPTRRPSACSAPAPAAPWACLKSWAPRAALAASLPPCCLGTTTWPQRRPACCCASSRHRLPASAPAPGQVGVSYVFQPVLCFKPKAMERGFGPGFRSSRPAAWCACYKRQLLPGCTAPSRGFVLLWPPAAGPGGEAAPPGDEERAAAHASKSVCFISQTR